MDHLKPEKENGKGVPRVKEHNLNLEDILPKFCETTIEEFGNEKSSQMPDDFDIPPATELPSLDTVELTKFRPNVRKILEKSSSSSNSSITSPLVKSKSVAKKKKKKKKQNPSIDSKKSKESKDSKKSNDSKDSKNNDNSTNATVTEQTWSMLEGCGFLFILLFCFSVFWFDLIYNKNFSLFFLWQISNKSNLSFQAKIFAYHCFVLKTIV